MITQLRKQLHSCPEPSMQEGRTKQLLMDFLKAHASSLELADRGQWFYAVKKCKDAKKSPIAFRADFDAVLCPDGIPRHLCGHDGHSAALAGFALWLDTAQPERDVYLIFQPGEETGQGAVVCTDLLTEKGIGEIYGFHNIPGYEKNALILPPRTFACASTGLEIRLIGRQSHAAYPENGVNPASAIAEIIRFMNEAIARPHKGIVLGTVIGMEAGSKSYGVSAGEGTLRLTLRAEFQDEYNAFVSEIEKFAGKQAEKQGLQMQTTRIEEFPATINDPSRAAKVREAAQTLGLPVICPAEPFRWSEDFGYYLQKTRGAFFGIGCGENHAGLHTMAYEFEDGLLPTVVALYQQLTSAH